MKTSIITILLVCLPIISFAQNAKITIGRGTNCFGRGACSISKENSTSYNASFVQNTNGTIILRIHRNKLTKEEEDRIFGLPINATNKNTLNFIMDEGIILPDNLKPFTAPAESNQLDSLKRGTYPTVVTNSYIDIELLNHNKP